MIQSFNDLTAIDQKIISDGKCSRILCYLSGKKKRKLRIRFTL